MTCLDSSCRQRREVELVGGATLKRSLDETFSIEPLCGNIDPGDGPFQAQKQRRHRRTGLSYGFSCCPKRRKHGTKVVPGNLTDFLGTTFMKGFFL